MKSLFFILVVIGLCYNISWSQVEFDTNKFFDDPIGFATNPYNYIFYNYIGDDILYLFGEPIKRSGHPRKFPIRRIKYVPDSIKNNLNKFDQYYLSDSKSYVFIRKNKRKFGMYKVLLDRPRYQLLCEVESNICDCGIYMKAYDKEKKELLTLVKTIAFTPVRKSIVKRLSKYGLIDKEWNGQKTSFCSFMQNL